jgi:hypothetical protein
MEIEMTSLNISFLDENTPMPCLPAMYVGTSSESLQLIDVYLHALVVGFASTPAFICESILPSSRCAVVLFVFGYMLSS